MTPHQIHDVQSSWRSVKGDRNAIVTSVFQKYATHIFNSLKSITQNGSLSNLDRCVVCRLFRETPRAQKLFAKFADVAQDQLAGNAEFQKQVSLVADRLDTIVEALDDKLQIMGNINYMRFSHVDRGVDRARWEDFGRLLMDVLGSKGVSAGDLDSWRGALGVFVNGVSPRH